MLLTTTDLIGIVSAGGGIILDTEYKTTEELVSIASASKHKGAKIILKNLTYRTTLELVSIASAGNGNVIFLIDNKVPKL